MSCTTTSIVSKLLLEEELCFGSKNESQIILTDFDDSVKNNVFWKRHLRRKAGLKEMEECVEELVKECHFWRQQLLALNYRNWNLEFEKKSLRDKYEGLLEKTKHDTNILLKLKDSQKKLTKKTKEYFKTDRELSKIHFVNTDQTSNRRLREMEWRNLANHLKKNTSIMAKINKFHNRIQSRIEEEKKRGEGNLEKCEKKMKVLRETLESNHAVYEDFQKILADREVPVDDLKALVTDGLKIYLGLEKKEEEEEEEEIESIDEEPEKELETGTPTELSEVGENKSETKVVEKEKSETTVVEKEKSVTKVVKKKESQLMNPAQRNIFEEWQSTRTLFLISKQMNSHLLKYYEFISSRMKELTGRFMEVNRKYNLKDSELQELQKKASDFRDTVRQKRRNCPIPPRDPRVELKLRIQKEMQENEGLRQALSQSFHYSSLDTEFYSSLLEEMKEFYKNLLSPETDNEDEASETANEPITSDEIEQKIK